MHTMTVTEDLDYALEVLLPEVTFFVIKDLFSISSEESKQCMLNVIVIVSTFRGEGW